MKRKLTETFEEYQARRKAENKETERKLRGTLYIVTGKLKSRKERLSKADRKARTMRRLQAAGVWEERV